MLAVEAAQIVDGWHVLESILDESIIITGIALLLHINI